MKSNTVRLTVIAIAVAGSLFMCGCKGDDSADSANSPLAGTWARDFNGSVVTLSLNTNGSYTVSMGGRSTTDVHGRYTAENDRITFLDEGGKNASTLGAAVYGFTIRDNQLVLTPISEPDDNRKSVATGTWTKS